MYFAAMNLQRWRSSNTFTATQWSAFLANATARNAFTRGAFALVVDDAGGTFVALYQKGQHGSDVAAFVKISPVTSGMTNPMTSVGDMIRGAASGAPEVLAVGASGYIIRSVAGKPEWRELSRAGLLSARQSPVSTLEGQSYWATNEAVGQQLSICVHQGSGVYAWVNVSYGAQSSYNFASSIGLTPYVGNPGNVVTVTNNVASLYSPALASQLRQDPQPLGGPALNRNFAESVAAFDVATRVLAPTGGVPDNNCRYGIEVAVEGGLVRERFTFSALTGALNYENQAGFQANLAGVVPLNGDGWLRIQLAGGFMRFWSGTSTGAIPPSTWTLKKQWIPTPALYESVCVSMQLGGAMPAPMTANFGALAVLVPASL